jgi:hypothetical protein
MATALFISRTDLARNSILDGSVDTDRFINFIKVAQQIHVRDKMGSKLYEKVSNDILNNTLAGDYLELVNEFIQPILIHASMVEYLPFAAYQIKNGGIFKHSSETATTPDKSEIDFLVNKHKEYADYYTQRFIDHMSFNQSKFPEYNQSTNDDIYPNKNTSLSSWNI